MNLKVILKFLKEYIRVQGIGKGHMYSDGHVLW